MFVCVCVSFKQRLGEMEAALGEVQKTATSLQEERAQLTANIESATELQTHHRTQPLSMCVCVCVCLQGA